MKDEQWEIIKYPISLDYRSHWHNWEAIREIVQNSMDASCPEDIEMYRDGEDLVIEDDGEGIREKHLLFGISEKDNNNSRGRFGEGLKIALLVLKRNGYDVQIKSGELFIKNDICELSGEKCLAVKYKKFSNKLSHTTVRIKNYDGTMYKNLFRGIGSTKINLGQNKHGEIIEPENGPKLFVKDIYVMDLEGAEFSYNVYDLRLEESRNIASEYDLKRSIKKIWGTVDNKKLFKRLFKGLESGCWESKIDWAEFYFHDEKQREALKKAFKEYFGENAVIGTIKEWAREARWRGAKVINMKCLSGLSGLLKTDEEFVREQSSKEIEIIPEDKLSSEERDNLEFVRFFIDNIDSREWNLPLDLEIKPARFEEQDNMGMSLNQKKQILLSVHILDDLEVTTETIVHEIAHISENTRDMTKDHLRAIEKIGSRMMLMLIDMMSTK